MEDMGNGAEQILKNESMTVKISPDKMNAFIIFHAPENGGKTMTRAEIEDYISIEGVKKGINQELMDILFESRANENLYNIARGKTPVPGEDGKVIYNFQVEKKIKPKERDDGTVDFFDLNLVENAREGDTLAVIMPPTDGEDGYNVLGENIFATKGRPANAKRGRNVSISDDGTKCLATRDGQVGLIDGKIVVSEVYQIETDVNTGTGNVNFVGSVVIKGNVLPDFKVFASGNIEVYGVVEGARLEAKGNITLHSGILGSGKGEIKAGGDLAAKYIENCKVSVGGNIVAEAIMHSIVSCSKNIEMGGKTGLIIGGAVTAGKLIRAKVIGSNIGTKTEIKVGVDPNLIDMYKKDKEEIEKIKVEKTKTAQILELLRAKDRKNLLDEEKKALLEKLVNTDNNMTKRVEDLEQEQELVMKKIEEIENGEIKVEQKIFSNVEIYVSSAYMVTKSELARCTLRKDGADVKISSY